MCVTREWGRLNLAIHPASVLPILWLSTPGTRVVLVHGSLATGGEEWQAQRPLADEGFRLLVPDRRGYGNSPVAEGEDFLRDADDIAELMGDSAHLVGHSYGGLGVLFAAARRPDATLSIALLEPGAFALYQDHPAARALVDEVRGLWGQNLPDVDWVIRFLKAVGSADALPPELITAAVPLVPVLRHGRPLWQGDLPLAELAAATFPKLVVSGGHSAGFDAICDDLAERIGASRAVSAGAGHEVQFTGQPLNDLLLALWRGSELTLMRAMNQLAVSVGDGLLEPQDLARSQWTLGRSLQCCGLGRAGRLTTRCSRKLRG